MVFMPQLLGEGRNSDVLRSVVNRTISTTVWPHLVRADAVNTRQVPLRVKIPSWTATASAALLIVASVLAPLGLYDDIVPGESRLVEFQYVKDPGPWGRVTMPRPDVKFNRYCESGLVINCPGQYQGVYMNETEPGHWESVETDDTSTINTTIPANFTTMFTSATSERGNTISGLFDIQYRRWKFDQNGIIDKGEPFVRGASQNIGMMVAQDSILLTEGLIVDMRDTPGIGFRNHTIPVGLDHGGLWSEDITWIEPVTQCADTNLSIEMSVENTKESFTDNTTFYIVDRGAFIGLDASALESPPWNDNQTLDLFGRAHKAARMHNVFVASSLNISLPLDEATEAVPKILVEDDSSAPAMMFSESSFDSILKGALSGVGGMPPAIPSQYSAGNASVPVLSHYPDGIKRLLALNYSAVAQVCRGYYELGTTDNDWRANNITYPAVQCGFLLGAPLQMSNENLSVPAYTGISARQRNLYICASGVRASIKTVDFRYNGTGGEFANLNVLQIKDKVYPNKQSQPLWASEHSYDKVMRFDPLWGIVDSRYETMGYKDGFYTLRAEKLWLATSPFLTLNFGETEGSDSLAGASGFNRRLGNLYGGLSDLGDADYSGQYDYTMLERWQRLSRDNASAAQIPSLIMTNGLAGGLVGTKTSISTKYVQWPASLAVDDTASGLPQASITEYKRVIHYNLRYAIPAFVILAILLLVFLWAAAIILSSRSILLDLQNMYNQTSTGRLATKLLQPGGSNPKEPTRKWVKKDGRLPLGFGQITDHEKDRFCEVVDDSPEVRAHPDSPSVPVGGDLGTQKTMSTGTAK
ncbi:uncharacterized protein A1O9_00673 [Exophiala aquamarina CBS 119918]|uniref:Uncharacterized protein n=1 Tax=Exophiala aquamarina CBS 119918 TaxID=1182545 RepID=A0A072Q467_9EURO|nr:uncharacterized protein A1O9_00673 [Exophiala aquamarina CBS 119918]KEF62700.1 hypothetical protein A1O9_00673 [Exophiala aquamarina CBS 119918]